MVLILQEFQGFQKAKELDGAIYAASNAALMRVQVGHFAVFLSATVG
jgi:hypothetical protein